MNTLNALCLAALSSRPARRAIAGLLRWLDRRDAPTPPSGPRPPDTQRLRAAQRFLVAELQGRWLDMSTRDRRLYRQLIHTNSLDTLRRQRFEGYDLMCRLLGESAAMARQRQIDTWLLPRR